MNTFCIFNPSARSTATNDRMSALFNIDGNVPLLQEETKVQLALDWMKCSVRKRNHGDQHRGAQCLSQLPEVLMTVVITYLAKDNAKSRYRARRAAKREQMEADARLARKIAVASTGCSLTVSRAINSPSLRSKHESGSACLPEVAQFAAGYRNSKNIVTAR